MMRLSNLVFVARRRIGNLGGAPNPIVGEPVGHLCDDVPTIPLDASYDALSFVEIVVVCVDFKSVWSLFGNYEHNIRYACVAKTIG